MTQDILSDRDLDVIFREARSFKGWQDMPVSEITIRALYDLLRWGPTAYNCSPARFTFVQTADMKEKLAACAMELNREKIMTAPFTAIVSSDANFYQKLPDLYKASSRPKDMFAKNEDMARETAFRNSCLQGGYMIIAARALGLDCCPMSGFDAGAVNKAFFDGDGRQANFLCSMGYGDRGGLPDRDARLSFDEACEIL